jgi:hypothetical protein
VLLITRSVARLSPDQATIALRETIMSKRQRGNKEAKKPKQTTALAMSPPSVGSTPTQATSTAPRPVQRRTH